MEGAAYQTQPRERSRGPPSYPRAPSRSSTSTSNTRATPQSTNSSTSHLVASPRPSSAHLHRYHGGSSGNPKPGTPRPPPAMLSRESTTASSESRHSVAASSSYLQEKLQRERKFEGERMMATRAMTDLSASMELRATQSSPVRSATSDGRRPRSSGGAGAGEPVKKKGMGVKEMEQTVSTLHKQNFDLKLELFHRRERQSAMEERMEALEAEKRQFEEMNDKLLEELEKRDKAVEEAVAMIVLLEAQVERLVKEREMVRRVDLDSLYGSRPDLFDPTAQAKGTAPRLTMADLARFEDNARAVNRMPSFLSEKSENTENLRNVYLGVRGSLLSLPRHGEDIGGGANNLTSPSLSVLSESSFTSVYGQKNGGAGAFTPQTGDSPGMEAGSSPDGRPVTRSNGAELDKASRDRIVTPSRLPRSNSITRPTGPGQFHSITDILDQGSPLQRLERLDRTFSLRTDASRTSAVQQQDRDRSMSLRTDAGPGTSSHDQDDIDIGRVNSLQRSRTKEEKREALRRVNTDAPAVRLHHDQGLPPTPDTISTSTLRHYKNSKDTLSNEGITNQRSFLALSEATSTGGGQASQPPSMTAFNSRREFAGVGTSYFDGRPTLMSQRPRSAGETTTSHRRGNEWDTDSDLDDDLHSVASTDDIWLREGAGANRRGGANGGGGRQSPDLFSFPPGSSGWNTNDLFSGYGGRGYASSPIQRSNPVDDLLPVQEALFAAGGPPPPPNRRSSLHARTGSTSATAALAGTPRTPAAPAPVVNGNGAGKLRKSPERGPGRGHARRNSEDAVHLPPRPASQSAAQGQEGAGKRGKDSHYPPIANQAPRGRGLNSLFRRSLGGGSSSSNGPTAVESAPASATEPTFASAAASSSAPKSSGGGGVAIGVPSWMHRTAALDDDRASATPPPIMRNRVPGRKGSFDGETGGASLQHPHGPLPPMTPVALTYNGAPLGGGPALMSPTAALPAGASLLAPQTSSGGTLSKRKWLPGFGRASSLRNRGG